MQYKVIDRRDEFVTALLPFGPQLAHGRHVDVHTQIEMRRALLALGHALADNAAHRSERYGFLPCCGSRRLRRFVGRRAQHVLGQNTSVGTAASETGADFFVGIATGASVADFVAAGRGSPGARIIAICCPTGISSPALAIT